MIAIPRAPGSGSPEGANIEFEWGCVVAGEFAEEFQARSTPFAPAAEGIVFRPGEEADRVFLVNSGEVVLTIWSHDRLALNARAVAGSIFGLSALVAEKPYAMTATAVKGAEIRAMGLPEFSAMMDSTPRMALQALQVLAAEARSALLALASFI